MSSSQEITDRIIELQGQLLGKKLRRADRRVINVEINRLQQEAWALQRSQHRASRAERREQNRTEHWARVRAEATQSLKRQRAPKKPRVDPDEQVLADRMGITVERLHEIQRERREEIAAMQSREKSPYGGLEDALSRAPVIGQRRRHNA